jgi:LytS/YehU family sensor histidine kinase
LPALFLALVADVHWRAVQLDSAAGAIEQAHAAASRGANEQQLAVLEAQVEPHFLFNVLGNVRSLYRAQP